MFGSWQEARMNRREHRERRESTELDALTEKIIIADLLRFQGQFQGDTH